ncbi:MAG: NAD(P)/FAD-dependent oxidoreductase [Methanomicrobiaceae archaeon]|nr:NAD(P)/FAD-dependent oxidoreductase [Methanomicrobiaceae archaeon]
MITVVGGGPAGRLAAIHLALAGEEVELIERQGSLGGQCLHQGCMVICGLNDCAKVIDESEKLRKLSVLDSKPKVSLPDLWAGINNIQSTISGILNSETEASGVSIVKGEAHLDGRELLVDNRVVETDKILIATGSKPFIPDIPGNRLSGVYNPHTVSGLREIPKNLVIVGGGIIAAEYSYIFSAFGADVTIVSRSLFLRDKPEILRKTAVKDIRNVDIREYTLLREICGENKVESVILENGGRPYRIDCDAVFFAAGLIPRTENISGISKGDMGEILINDRYKTDIEGVYAAGDVTGRVFMTPYARMQGISAARSMLGETPPEMPQFIPQSLKLFYEHSFCFKNREKTFDIGLPSPAGPGSFWSVPERNTGRSVISVEKATGDVRGMYLGAPSSSAVASYMAYLMEKGVNVSDFERFIEVHPSADGISPLIKYAGSLKKNE